MRFLRRNSTDTASDDTADTAEAEVEDAQDTAPRGHTPAKGRPTPKRREAEGRKRGPVAPPPRTTREAIKRSREMRKKNPVSKEDRRNAARTRRERMMAGDEKYLLPRDRGPVKAYIRDLVDSRRNFLGLFMPLALLVFAAMLVQNQVVQYYSTLLITLMLLLMIVEGVLQGRRITRKIRAKFPDEHVRGLSVGWYSFIRASQIRKLRVPKPRVKPGDKVA
ncbi:DUF3043 family protein [Herbihabitans rhizosphaerae]|uniref:DUF3043 family protein n=1 Tax=Herbihabitans rhizosphaerae TaxID=1872711 RepID=A0A4Q7KSV7_9PSEU|nr:DUF3043 domain-containing protein [Herbihabitans rhizosphaerae]RZS38871.1 DUF3043 family protein [Herbihabitans rhizosphaerae]